MEDNSMGSQTYMRQSRNYDNRQKFKKLYTGPKKQIIRQSASEIVTFVFTGLCKRYLLLRPSVKIGTYTTAVCIASLLRDFMPVPRIPYASDRFSFPNRFFTQFGFLWVLIILFCLIYTSCLVYTNGARFIVIFRQHISRLLVSTLIWWLLTTFFERVQLSVGMCADPTITSKKACRLAEKAWIGLDISGHVFLLIHNLLTMAEEAKVLKVLEEQRTCLQTRTDIAFDHDEPLSSELAHLEELHSKYSVYVRLLVIILTSYVIFCELMLVCTCLYYHTLAEKMIAATLAVICWFLSYQFWYRLNICPCSPGANAVKVNQYSS